LAIEDLNQPGVGQNATGQNNATWKIDRQTNCRKKETTPSKCWFLLLPYFTLHYKFRIHLQN